jgi:hypothetical protein
MVNNIFTYGPDGKVFLCAINFPVSWHDGSLMTFMFSYIHENIRCFKICIYHGFPRSGDAAGILVGPKSKKPA